MTDAVDTMLHDWAIPRMNARHIVVTVFENNVGSVKVFLKNGFEMKETVRDHVEVKGILRSSHILEWTRESQP